MAKEDAVSVDEESQKKKSSFPKSLFFIIGNEFCERYSFYGMHTILILYLTIFLRFDDDTATIIYHSFIAVSYFVPLFGGILADSYWGKYKTILYLSIVYTIGMALNAISAVPDIGGYGKTLEDNVVHVALHITGLVLIAIGTGGIKPCVSSFGGDQFEEGQEEALSNFFGFFYFAINAGSLVSTFVSPIMRDDVHCFGRDDCYFAAFIIPVGLMIISVILFVLGKRFYIIREPAGNIFYESCQITWHAWRQKCKRSDKKETRDHWLDWAKDGRFLERTVDDLKFVFPVAVMFTPLPFFWALFDMQGSRWTLTATQTNGYIFGDDSSAKMLPDQMQIVNPVLILALIPIFSYGIYPLCEKCGIKVTELRKMSGGMVIAALAFIVSGFVQIAIDNDLTDVPRAKESAMVFYNGRSNDITVTFADYWDEETPDTYVLEPGHRTPDTFDKVVGVSGEERILTILDNGVETMTVTTEDSQVGHHVITDDIIRYTGQEKKSPDGRVIFQVTNALLSNMTLSYFTDPECTDYEACSTVMIDGFPARATSEQLILDLVLDQHLSLYQNNYGFLASFTENDESVSRCVMQVSEEKFLTGSIWSLLVIPTDKDGVCKITTFQDSNPNTVNMLTLIPQFVIITIAEVLISVTGLEFAYTQAPVSMKSVLTSFWLLTVCFGNIIDLFIVSIDFTDKQSTEYFVFAALVAVAAAIFILLSMFYYEYVPEGQFYESKAENEHIEDEKKEHENPAFDGDETDEKVQEAEF